MEKGERRKQIEGLLKDQRAEQVRQRDAAMKEFDKTYPADPRALVAMRLRHFLDVTKDVDFTAQLVEKGKNRVFADRGPRGQAGRVENVFSGRKTRHRRRPGLRPEMAERPAELRV